MLKRVFHLACQQSKVQRSILKFFIRKQIQQPCRSMFCINAFTTGLSSRFAGSHEDRKRILFAA